MTKPMTDSDPTICGDDGPITPEQCALWLDAKYRRHGELQDRAAAMWLRKLSASSSAVEPSAEHAHEFKVDYEMTFTADAAETVRNERCACGETRRTVLPVEADATPGAMRNGESSEVAPEDSRPRELREALAEWERWTVEHRPASVPFNEVLNHRAKAMEALIQAVRRAVTSDPQCARSLAEGSNTARRHQASTLIDAGSIPAGPAPLCGEMILGHLCELPFGHQGRHRHNTNASIDWGSATSEIVRPPTVTITEQ